MDFLGFLVTQCLNALSQAALLFFLGVGLTLIFGIMRIVNFAHGAFFMLGAYVGYSAVTITGSFWAALIAAPLLVGAFGAAFEMGILRRLYRRDHSAFLMVTFGLTLIMGEAIRLLWGVAALDVPVPKSLSGIVFILDEPFPIYRLFLVGAGIVVAIAIWQFLERTRLGLLIRATSQNAEMVHALGTDVRLVRSGGVRHRLRPRRHRRRVRRAIGHRVARHGAQRSDRHVRHRHHRWHGQLSPAH